MTNTRDRVLGRIAVAQHFVGEIQETLNAAVAHFVETDEDMKGKERRELLEQAEYGAHMIATAVGEAMSAFSDMGRELLEEGENLGDDDDDVVGGDDEDEE